MDRVARCGHCQQFFDLPEGQLAPEAVEEIQSTGLMPVRKIFLCPPCRQASHDRGQPPAPPEPPAPTPEVDPAVKPDEAPLRRQQHREEEAPQEEPPEEEPSA